MKDLSRYNLYATMLEDNNITDQLRMALLVNLTLIKDIENQFIDYGKSSIPDELVDLRILTKLDKNVNDIEDQYKDNKVVISTCHELHNLIKEYKVKNQSDTIIVRRVFNKLINALSEFNNKVVSLKDIPQNIGNYSHMPQVFLSHAYDDRLYSLALFLYCYNKGIFLYVDWMNNPKCDDGRKLKSLLKSELDKSSQLLFLRTLNSELNIQGKQMLRSWCAWELGNFYAHSLEKYVLCLYGNNIDNLQMHGLIKLDKISNGQLMGSEEIEP